MQAIILAAGMGRRLGALTRHNTKCMIEVGGTTIIERDLRQLDALGIRRIVIVVGYQAQGLINHIEGLNIRTPIEFVLNRDYERTNNIFSLSLVSDRLMEDDTLLLESDVVLEDGILHELAADPRPILALVDRYEAWMDGTVTMLDDEDRILSFVPGNRLVFSEVERYFKTVNVYKFSKEFSTVYYVPFLNAYTKAMGLNEYYEQVLRVITLVDDSGLRAKRLEGYRWYEIDDVQDLDIAESIFATTPSESLACLVERFGGYWRYPHLLDYCYLVNPYYPPHRMMEEIRASFGRLLTSYPSGMRVNCLLGSKLLGLPEENVAVGNGAASLIKTLMTGLEGRVGIVRPTFEEYPNRLNSGREVTFVPCNEDFSYSADDLVNSFDGTDISTLVLINPDNPTGNYIPRGDVLRLAEWCELNGTRLIYDESFADFADEPCNSLFDEEVLAAYPHLTVVKSLSKSYGIPGCRLGVLASADVDLVEMVRTGESIWSINSFAEFWLQIAEKYQSDYQASLQMVRSSRRRMSDALARIPQIRVYPSQANYLMIELTGQLSSAELSRRLLAEHSILVKDLTEKLNRGGRQFIRLAIRCDEENDRLVEAIARIAAESGRGE